MESLVNYLVLVAVAAVAVWYDLRIFALYAFMVIVGLIIYFTGRIWKLIRMSHAATNAKIAVVAKKVGVSDKDYDDVVDNMRKEHPEAWATLERDLKGL